MSIIKRIFPYFAILCALAFTGLTGLAAVGCANPREEWAVPVVDRASDSRQKYYSLFYEEGKPTADPGSALSKFAFIHDGDTFGLGSDKGRDFKQVAALLAGRLKAKEFTVAASTRLFGVDAPEISGLFAGSFQPTAGLQKLWADRAAKFVKKQLGYGKEANKSLVTINGKESYSRNVANIKYVPQSTSGQFEILAKDKQIGWNDLAADLVRYGLARVAYTGSGYVNPSEQMPGVNALNRVYIDYLIELQSVAIAKGIGLWAEDKDRWWGAAGESAASNLRGNIFPNALGISKDNGLKRLLF